jgi:hypothetical protein
MKNFNNYKFRSSQIYRLLTQPKTKKDRETGKLSATTEMYLLELAVEAIYGRAKEIESDAMSKGIDQEQNAIELLSEMHQTEYAKNVMQLENDYITGTPDILEPLIDIKIPKDIFSHCGKSGIPKVYEYQLYCYMILTQQTKGYIAYILANSPDWLIEKEFNKKSYYKSEDTWQELEETIRKQHIFDDIPLNKRIKIFELDYKKDVEYEIYNAVEKGRNYMNNLTI